MFSLNYKSIQLASERSSKQIFAQKLLFSCSLNLFSQLEKETGQAINFHTPGSIRIAITEEKAEEMRYGDIIINQI